MSVQSLVHRFDAVMTQVYKPSPRPTSHSITRIEAHFDIRLPKDFVYFSRNSRYFSNWFASLGPDYDSPLHIIRINSYWRRRRTGRRIPPNLVAFTLGFDDDLNCFELDRFFPETEEYAIRYWSPGVEDTGARHLSFISYAKENIQFWENLKSRATQ